MRVSNHTQTAIGTVLATLATGAVGWQVNTHKADALEDAMDGWLSCQATIQEIALNVSREMSHSETEDPHATD